MGEGTFSKYSEVWSVLAAVQWMLPLVVESIWDGDSAARLKIVTIANYNSVPPLPQIYKSPLSSYATLDKV